MEPIELNEDQIIIKNGFRAPNKEEHDSLYFHLLTKGKGGLSLFFPHALLAL